MPDRKKQIKEKIAKEREHQKMLRQDNIRHAEESKKRFDEIRPLLDELRYTADTYSLDVGYLQKPDSVVVAVVELNDIKEAWVVKWYIAATVDDGLGDWEVTYSPVSRSGGSEYEWFDNSDDLFEYLTACIARCIVEMETDGE